jgi:hypothetical protein
MPRSLCRLLACLAWVFWPLLLSANERTTAPSSIASRARPEHEWGRSVSLDGTWEIADGLGNQPPKAYPAKIEVPGLVTTARPAFDAVGEQTPARDSFWYRRRFRVEGEIPPVVRLKIGKAMFGTEVFLNGRRVGASPLNFTPLYFDVSGLVRGHREENELVIRLGAHIANVPDTVTSGGDPERHRYPPGIYDHMALLLSDDPYVAHAQVAPDPKDHLARIAVDFTARAASARSLRLRAVIREWKSGRVVSRTFIDSGEIVAGQLTRSSVTLPIPDGRPWTPESPFLYVLELSDGHYSYATRFGLRTFAVDPAFTNRALLNGSPCFIRGTNFAVHRIFEDEHCHRHPWEEAWVRKLFRTFRAMGMNGVRLTIGPAPELWYDIADEEGMMIFDEYAIWYAYQPAVGDVSKEAADPHRRWGIWPNHLTTAELTREFTSWMQERCNHPSVIVWDAQNETWAPQTGAAIAAVRHLDLSNRPWDNGWSPPQRATDIREAHTYFERLVTGTEMMIGKPLSPRPSTLADLATAEKIPSTFYLPYQDAWHLPHDWHWTQPCVINEYSYLWLHRDGTPTKLTRAYYDAALGPQATADQRRELYARYLAAVTEYWRAARTCFGVLYPFGLAGSIPDGSTSDNFTDVETLTLDPFYRRFVPDAFAPVGVCAELWQTDFKIVLWRGTQAEFPVAVINDTAAECDDCFEVTVNRGSIVISRHRYRYQVAPFGLDRTHVKIDLPATPGNYEIVTTLHCRNQSPVSSYRPIRIHE